MADISVLSSMSAEYPTLSDHVATKDYVDVTARDLPINTRTAAYTLVAADEGKCVEVNSSSALQVTVPLNSAVPFPVNTRIWVRKMGTGNVTVAGASGVTINWASAFVVSTRYTRAEIHKVATDTWIGILVGS